MKTLITFAMLLTSTLSAIPLVNGGAVTLSTTPTALASGPNYVQRVTVKVIPGYTCKVFIGAAGHNRSDYSGVYAILYPNATGGHSEEFTLEAPAGNDGINLASLYLSSDCPGEQVNYMYFQTGTLGATLRFLRGGPVTPSSGTYASFWGGSTNLAALVRVQVIPGMTGKIRVKGQNTFTLAQLYPNTGNTAQNNAHSEKWIVSDRNSTLRPDLMYLAADVAGEGALVTVLTYN